MRLQKIVIVMNAGVFGIKSQHCHGFRTLLEIEAT